MESEFFPDPLFERRALFKCEGVGFGDDGDNVYYVGQLLEDDNVNWFEAENIFSTKNI